MATNTGFTVSAGWTTGARITAVGATALLLRNPTRVPVFFVITNNDTLPTDAVVAGHILPAFLASDAGKSQLGLELADTERLWLATSNDTVNITVTPGAA